ncbi:hypothetical protein LINGRAHAP2_LOCUS34057 [Linum grandiflorum]
MSRMKFDRKPPLPKSPIRLRSRQITSASSQTPPGSMMKSAKPSRPFGFSDAEELRPEYRSMSCELRALAKMVRDELGNGSRNGSESLSADSSPPCFQRGRLYEEYSARRNERLKRKRGGSYGGSEDSMRTPYKLGVTVSSSTKRRDSMKKTESLRRSVVASGYGGSAMRQGGGGGGEAPRYLLRSMCKENKATKLPLPPVAPLRMAVDLERSAIPSGRKIGVRRSVRKI